MEPRIEPRRPAGAFDAEVTLSARGTLLSGHLFLPMRTVGVVLFAHGSGSSRMSPRNQLVARELNQAGFGTLLFDLLNDAEELDEMRGAMRRFDVGMLAERVEGASEWVANHPLAGRYDLAYFGASTGAAAALVAAGRRPANVRAVVSRGGRPDLAGDWLGRVIAPVLLVVGERDPEVLALNRRAQALLPASEIVVVPGAGHLFEEPGKLAEVAALAARWLSGVFGARADVAAAPSVGEH